MAAELTDEQNAMREMALEFARTKLAPFAGEWDPIRRAWLGAIRCSFAPLLEPTPATSKPPERPARSTRPTVADCHVPGQPYGIQVVDLER